MIDAASGSQTIVWRRDVLVVSILCLFFFKELNLDSYCYLVYQTISWFVISFLINIVFQAKLSLVSNKVAEYFYIIQLLFSNISDKVLAHHFTVFFLFFLALILFFKTIKLVFEDEKLALLGVLILYLSPRIFADSFFNSKDIVFLSGMLICFYTLIQFFIKQNFTSLFIHSFISQCLGFKFKVNGIGYGCCLIYNSCIYFFNKKNRT